VHASSNLSSDPAMQSLAIENAQYIAGSSIQVSAQHANEFIQLADRPDILNSMKNLSESSYLVLEIKGIQTFNGFDGNMSEFNTNINTLDSQSIKLAEFLNKLIVFKRSKGYLTKILT
jgi:hypothetical protein